MNTNIFILSGLVSLVSTLTLIVIIYNASPSTRAEMHIGRIIGIVLAIYTIINVFYYFKLIPPVPLALETGIAAHDIKVENNNYIVTFENNAEHIFWREHKLKFTYNPDQNVYVFASIFAPTEIKKLIFHRWKWYNDTSDEWEIIEDIGYDISGGRNGGYRGYTFKNNVKEGLWKVDVITEEELVIGVIDFEIVMKNNSQAIKLVEKKF
ncbi:DUF2914 domain-containing protein [Mariniflexile gromovii]|uniref:DUF2914 domain-containing protein n=1 Tax=Mariniflexile gromovii TaxID=362523 RepID=UPI00293D6167|nr:DUF2914 domain-containing protein [Mariniflexile gromovii]